MLSDFIDAWIWCIASLFVDYIDLVVVSALNILSMRKVTPWKFTWWRHQIVIVYVINYVDILVTVSAKEGEWKK